MCTHCQDKGWVAWAEPCDCIYGQLYGLHIMLVGPKIATGHIDDIKIEINVLKDRIQKLQSDVVKMGRGECPDCYFWKQEADETRKWTREVIVKLRKENKDLKHAN